MGNVNNQQGKIFNNQILEIFAKSSPMLTLITYGSVILLFLAISYKTGLLSIGETIGLFISGAFFWTFFEYLMHRYVFHFMSEYKFIQKFHYMVHGVHHENPRDKERIFMPPLPGLIIIAVVYVLFYLVLGNFSYSFLAGWLTGYLAYSFIHYHVHLSKPVPWIKKLWLHHALHHYKDDTSAFGVSTPLWDYVFRTMPNNVKNTSIVSAPVKKSLEKYKPQSS